jgi:hypothetical protein
LAMISESFGERRSHADRRHSTRGVRSEAACLERHVALTCPNGHEGGKISHLRASRAAFANRDSQK